MQRFRLVDTHFHADLQEDPAAIVSECESEQTYTIAVTNAPSVFEHTKGLTLGKAFVRAAVGLHPELIHSHGQELPDLLRFMGETKYVGEVGLDYVTSDGVVRKRQREVFEAVIARGCELGGRIVTVHSRRAAADVIECVGPGSQNRVILHWFSGAKRELVKGLDAGCFFSVNPAMVGSERSLALLKHVPRERVLTETDGPFVKVRGRGAVPRDVGVVLAGLANIWGVDAAEAAEIAYRNFKSVVEQFDRF